MKRLLNAWLWETRTNRSYQLFEGDTRIGRGYHNDIVLMDDTVSKDHALIRHVRGMYTLYPQAARVPIRINGYIIDGAQALANDDELLFGETLLRFRC